MASFFDTNGDGQITKAGNKEFYAFCFLYNIVQRNLPTF